MKTVVAYGEIMIRTIELFTKAKGRADENEDGLVLKDAFIAVIDGVTSKGTLRWNGRKSGCFAKEILTDYLYELDALPSSADTFFYTLNQQLKHAVFAYWGTIDLPKEEFPRACIIVLNAAKNEVWNYGDCQCIVQGQLHKHEKLIDVINAEKRAAVNLRMLSSNRITMEAIRNHDPGRDAIMDSLLDQYDYENIDHPYGYPVLNGYSFNRDYIQTYPVQEGETVILATDGYPSLHSTLRESEESLRRILVEDPLCLFEYKGTKGLSAGNTSFDDRTYWRGIIGERVS